MTRLPANWRSSLVDRRVLPLALLSGLTIVAVALGWHRMVSLETVAQNHAALRSYIVAHLPAAMAMYIVLYTAVVALSLPGGLVLTVGGGLLFGWKLAAPAAIMAATAGATLVFLAAKTAFAEPLAARAGPWLERLKSGFQANAFSYLLFLRLVPLFPFFAVNLAPALLGVPLGTYVLATLIGIIPGTLAFALAGSGLGRLVEAQNAVHAACLERQTEQPDLDCTYTLTTGAFLTPDLLAAFVLMGIVALLPVLAKAWRRQHGDSKG